MNIVYLNGEYVERELAKISVMDRGFLFGDGVYEVIPVYKKNIFSLSDHLRRLQNSLKNIRIDYPIQQDMLRDIIMKLLQQNQLETCLLYIQITRGIGERLHAFPPVVKPTLFMYCLPYALPTIEQLDKPHKAITADDMRWKYCNIKSINLLPNVLVSQLAMDHKAVEAILIRDGLVIEGASSNVFMIKDNVLLTPPEQQCMLTGITRTNIIKIAEAIAFPVKECPISLKELQQADEVWTASSGRTIIPITQIDDIQIGDGKPGKTWKTFIKKLLTEMEVGMHEQNQH